MNDLPNHCEHWSESLSLAAAGCLSSSEESDLRQHIDSCPECREHFRQLTNLCGAIVEAREDDGLSKADIVQRVMSAVESTESASIVSPKRFETIRQKQHSRVLDKWRWIMRSPISRISTAVAAVVAVLIGAFWLQGGGSPALADFIAPILQAKSAKFKITTEVQGPPAVTTKGEVLVLDGTRSRQELVTQMPNIADLENPAEFKMVVVYDWRQGKSLSLTPATNTAVVITLDNLTEAQIAEQDMFAAFRAILLDARDKTDIQRESLGEKVVEGKRVIGFRMKHRGITFDLWGDPVTGLPVKVESTMSLAPGTKTTMSDFVFNVEMDESLFSVEVPAGYKVQNMRVDASPAKEEDLIVTFREYQKLSGGTFPKSLDIQSITAEIAKRLAAEVVEHTIAPKTEDASQEPEETTMDGRIQKFAETQARLQRGLLFALATLPAEADAHYAGKDVSYGDADVAIFWYKPQDSSMYRVISADLSVTETATPPSNPSAQEIHSSGDPAN